jgi:GNAT superfamily N-acetyltransferase
MLREATLDDVGRVIQFMKAFEQETAFVKVNVAYCTGRYEELIRTGKGVIFVLENEFGDLQGALAAITGETLHDGTRYAVETFWFTHPKTRGKGLKLLNAFDRWANAEGCRKKCLIHLEDSFPERLARVYRRRGYRLIERHYEAEVII